MTPRGPVVVALVLTLALQEFPANAQGAAARDLSEARRRFAAAVRASDQALAAARAAVESALANAAGSLGVEDQRARDALRTLKKGLTDFAAEREKILARDLGSPEQQLRAINDYERTIAVLAAIIVAVMAIIVAIVGAVAVVGGTALVLVPVVLVVVSAILMLVVTILANMPMLIQGMGEILRAMGCADAGDSLDSIGRWWDRNVNSQPVGNAIKISAAILQIIGAILRSTLSAESGLKSAEAAARDAQARLQALPKAPSPPPFLTTFDGYLGSAFAIHLDSGKATVGPSEAALEGGVTISPKSDPSVKLTVNGRVVFKARAGASTGLTGPSFDHTTERSMILGAGQQIATWTSLEGQVSARITGFGPVITIPNVALQSQLNSVMLTGGDASLRGCTHTLAAGSGFSTSQVRLEGSLRCGQWSLTTSSMGIDKTGVSGGGTLTAWSKRFAMTYSASGDALMARGSLSGADAPWTRVPGFEAEYRIEAPKLDLKLDGPALSPTFGAGKVNVRTIAKRPDGNPWASASLTPDVIMVPAPPTDGIPVPFPVLPAPSDVDKAARDACDAGARRTLAGQALQHALDVCRSGHPSPPAVPTLPRSVSLKVGEVFR